MIGVQDNGLPDLSGFNWGKTAQVNPNAVVGASMFSQPAQQAQQPSMFSQPAAQSNPSMFSQPANQSASMVTQPKQEIDIYGQGNRNSNNPELTAALQDYQAKMYQDLVTQSDAGEDWGGVRQSALNDKYMGEIGQKFGWKPEDYAGVDLGLLGSLSQYNGVNDPVAAMKMIKDYSAATGQRAADAPGTRDGLAYALANNKGIQEAYDFANKYQNDHRDKFQEGMKIAVPIGLALMGGAAISGAGAAAGSAGTAAGSGTAAAGTGAASGVAGQLGMSPGMLASGVNSGAMTTGMSLASGRNIGDSLKAGVIGGVTGGAMSGLSSALAPTLGNTGASMFSQGVGTLARGGNLNQALTSGLTAGAGQYASGALSPYIGQTAAGALTNAGITAARGGNVGGSLLNSGIRTAGSMFGRT